MVCPICGDHFMAMKVRIELKLTHNINYDDIPGRWCYNCSMNYVDDNKIVIFEGADDDDEW